MNCQNVQPVGGHLGETEGESRRWLSLQALYPFMQSRVLSSPAGSTKAQTVSLRHPLGLLFGLRQTFLFTAPFGPHSFRCPFKKEEILFINNRPNLSVQSTAFPAGFRVMGATFRQRISHRLNPGKRLTGHPFLLAALDSSRLGCEEPEESGGGT